MKKLWNDQIKSCNLSCLKWIGKKDKKTGKDYDTNAVLRLNRILKWDFTDEMGWWLWIFQCLLLPA